MDVKKIGRPFLGKVFTDSQGRMFIYIKKHRKTQFETEPNVIIQQVQVVREKVRIFPNRNKDEDELKGVNIIKENEDNKENDENTEENDDAY